MPYNFNCPRACLTSVNWMKAKPHLEQTGCESTPKSEYTFVLHSLPETVSHASEMDINRSIVGKPRALRLFKRHPGRFITIKRKPR